MLLNKDAEEVLVLGLRAMTRSCELITKENERLREDVADLEARVIRLKERVLTDQEERE
jgi:hypothetical protein